MTNNEKLALLDAALENGAVEWYIDVETNVLVGYYSDEDIDNGYPLQTEYQIDTDSEGTNWIIFQDVWPEGSIVTGCGRLCQV